MMALAFYSVQDSFMGFGPAFGRLAGCQFLGILLTLPLLSTLGGLGLLNHAQFCVSFGHSDSGPQNITLCAIPQVSILPWQG